MPDIVLSGVCLSFGAKSVLTDLDAVFPAGKITALVGASGSGKTTLLRVIAGLQKPDRGTLSLPAALDLAVSFQEPRLFPWLTVRRNLTCVMPPDVPDPDAYADELLALAELDGTAALLPDALSGGMQQRLSLIRALASRRSVLLLDEPFRGVDEACKDRIISRLRPLLSGKTVVFVTHDPHEIELLADGKVQL